MKKKLVIILSFLLIIACLTALVACVGGGGTDDNGDKDDNKGDDPSHKHTYIHHVAVSATCGSDGSVEYWSCSGCDKLFSDDKGTVISGSIVIPATNNHSYGEWNTTKEPTCTETGAKERVCGVCSIIETAVLKLLGIALENGGMIQIITGKNVRCAVK